MTKPTDNGVSGDEDAEDVRGGSAVADGSEFDVAAASPLTPAAELTDKQQAILSFISDTFDRRGTGPSVREVQEAVGYGSPATAQYHLKRLIDSGWLARDPDNPRLLIPRYDWASGTKAERRRTRYVPLVGDVAAGTDVIAQENVEELLPLPFDLTGGGQLFMLRVRGDSMVEAGILSGDYVVARAQKEAQRGDVVVAGIDGEEATVKRFRPKGETVALEPANSRMPTIIRPASEVTIYGKVVTVVRRL